MHPTSISLSVLPLLYDENRTQAAIYYYESAACSHPLRPAVPSVSLSAMRGSSETSSGLVTTMEVSGVTKLYCSDMSRAFAVALSFSSVVPLLLQAKHPDPPHPLSV